jgi:hypothetical protein
MEPAGWVDQSGGSFDQPLTKLGSLGVAPCTCGHHPAVVAHDPQSPSAIVQITRADGSVAARGQGATLDHVRTVAELARTVLAWMTQVVMGMRGSGTR